MIAPERKAPDLLPQVREAAQALIDVIAVDSEDVHMATFQLNAALLMVAARFEAAQKEAVAELDGMIAARRQARRAVEARERLAAVTSVPGPVIPSKGKRR